MDIDTLYDAFCSSLPSQMQALGRSLACELKLAPTPDIPWSGVFKHAVTLEAPRLLSPAMPGVDPRMIERGVLAHMLSVIEAFGADRLADGQIEDKPELRRLLELARQGRDEALFGIGSVDAVRMALDADRQTLDAIATERTLLTKGAAIDFATYESVSAGKQAVGLPASLALAKAAGLDPEKVDIVRSTLLCTWLGLQFRDDVVDWEEDAGRGGAWALLLARKEQPDDRPPSRIEELTQWVLRTGVLAEMLRLSAARFQTARVGAEMLGAEELTGWLRGREAEAFDLCERERNSPGYVRRARLLAPWAAEVLG